MKHFKLKLALPFLGCLVFTLQEITAQTIGITVDASGNLGVGLKNPVREIHTTGNIQFDGRQAFFGADQFISADNNSAFYFNSNNTEIVQFILRDKDNEQYGRLYGTGSGRYFGLLNAAGNWITRHDNVLSEINFYTNNNLNLQIRNSEIDVTNNKLVSDAGTIRDANGGWVRTYGSTGWFSQTYGGGWYMADDTWIRGYGNKGLYMGNSVIRTDGGSLQVGVGGTNFNANSTKTTVGPDPGGIFGFSMHRPGYSIVKLGASENNGILLRNVDGNGHIDANGGDMYLNWYRGTGVTVIGNSGGNYGTIQAAFFQTLSDRREKENIENVENSLEKVLKLRGVTFDWKSRKENKKDAGFIAQEVKDVIPELVSSTELPKMEGEESSQERFVLNYQGILPYLVEAIKLQQQQISELKNEVAMLESKISVKSGNESK